MIVASDYAQALYELAEEQSVTEGMLEEVKSVQQILGTHPEYSILLDSPAVPKPQRLQLLDESFGSLYPVHLNFLKILCEKSAVKQYKDCATGFADLYNRAHGILQATAITATAMTDVQKLALTGKLEGMTGKSVALENVVDPSVLGGVTLRFGGIQVDGSLKARLDELRQRLTNAIV